MTRAVSIHGYASDAGQSISVDTVPETCPICHHHIDVRVRVGAAVTDSATHVDFVFQCPRRECRRLFIGYYERGGSVYHLKRVAPQRAQVPDFPADVRDISPRFVTVYSQAIEADAAGLDQIAGMGLRKAVEFLVKDYAIHEHPSDEEKIKKMALAACIRAYITDPNVKACAARATWLGNDETHYVRQWEDRDVGDLKLLVRLMLNWIENGMLTARYINEMPEK